MTPQDFLSWAEEDLKSNDNRAIGNALSNLNILPQKSRQL